MGVNELEREQAILDAAAELLLRLGYNKVTMGDVAENVALHRGLVYLRFRTKDELVEALVLRETNRYADRWQQHLEADALGGSVASVYRAMVRALRELPLAAAIVGRDETVFGKYLRKPGNVFERLRNPMGTQHFLDAMREVGAVRDDIDTRAVAFVLDTLTPALRQTFPDARAGDTERPSTEELVDALSDMLERSLNPSAGPDLAAGKRVLIESLTRIRGDFDASSNRSEGAAS
ncbi:TetR/AcrR family transcriptional regulator [Nocardia sp. NPDC050406]|uniref:TetR/AcrR family transcriptional regulator n=1 Tax=Nocardia sp. NPDC050406 TaxID=3364318 RepID=UPI0037A07FE2